MPTTTCGMAATTTSSWCDSRSIACPTWPAPFWTSSEVTDRSAIAVWLLPRHPSGLLEHYDSLNVIGQRHVGDLSILAPLITKLGDVAPKTPENTAVVVSRRSNDLSKFLSLHAETLTETRIEPLLQALLKLRTVDRELSGEIGPQGCLLIGEIGPQGCLLIGELGPQGCLLIDELGPQGCLLIGEIGPQGCLLIGELGPQGQP